MTRDHPLRKVDRAFAQLVREIQRLESTRDVTTDQDSHVGRALDFIKRNQNSDGSWGLGAMIDVIVSLQSLGLWCPGQDTWTIKSNEVGGIDSAFRWLERNQRRGSWDGNIWDTAAIIQAAAYHNRLELDCIRRAITWLAAQKQSNWGLDHGLPPHYAAQALLAFVRSGAHPEHVHTLQSLLLRRLRNDFERVTRSLYISGQILEALVTSGIVPTGEPVGQLLDSLKSALLEIDVTIANFLDICAGFSGLGAAAGGIDPGEDAIQLTLANLFNPNRLREDGSWYHDLTLSGWALVALRQVQQVRKIDAYPQRVYGLLASTATQVRATVQRVVRDRRETAVYGLLLVLSVWFTMTCLYLGIFGGFRVAALPPEVAFFLAPLGLTVTGIALRGLVRLLR